MRVMSKRVGSVLAALLLTGAVGAVLLVRGSAHGLPRQTWVAPAPSASSWAEVLARAPVVTLHTLGTGCSLVFRPEMLRRDSPERSAVPEPHAPLPVFAHLVRHPKYGDVLIDSGLSAEFSRDPFGNIGRPARWVMRLLLAPFHQDAGEDIGSQLRRLGARPQRVFFTHLHPDHTSGVPSLPPGVSLVTGPGEADDFAAMFGYGHFDGVSRLEELDFSSAPTLAPLGRAVDVWGDGSLWAVSTPGHSRGHLSFVVNAVGGPVLLTGDASHFRWAFEHGIGPAAPRAEAEVEGQRSLDALRAFSQAFPSVRVLYGHEAPGQNADPACAR